MNTPVLRALFFYVVFLLALNTVVQEIKETTVVYMEEDGTVGVSKKMFFGMSEKYYVARVRNHKWETKLLYEKKFGKIEAKEEPWKEIFYNDY